MRTVLPIVVAVLVAATFLGCGGSAPGGTPPVPSPDGTALPATPREPLTPTGPEPEYVTVDHILIGVKGSQLPTATREAADAKTLAYDLLRQIQGGGDWDALKARYSEDRMPARPVGGPYTMANIGQPVPPGGFKRTAMAEAFGDTGFALAEGGVAVADHDPARSPFGFHIIKRLPCHVTPVRAAGAQHILIQWHGIKGAPPSVTRGQGEARKLAEEVRALATQPAADWNALVRDYSDDARTNRQDGWLGVAIDGKVVGLLKPVADALFAVAEGECTPVVETDIGYHVARRASSVDTARASHILLPWRGAQRAEASITRTREEARALAERLVGQLRAGESFAALAADHSSCPSKAQGGDVKWVERGSGSFAWAFERAVFALPVGGISDPVETEFGWHLIQRTR